MGTTIASTRVLKRIVTFLINAEEPCTITKIAHSINVYNTTIVKDGLLFLIAIGIVKVKRFDDHALYSINEIYRKEIKWKDS